MRNSCPRPRTLLAIVIGAALLAGPRTQAAPPPSSTLLYNQSLASDGEIVSQNGQYRATLQKSDGNFVVYDKTTGKPTWATNVTGRYRLEAPHAGRRQPRRLRWWQ